MRSLATRSPRSMRLARAISSSRVSRGVLPMSWRNRVRTTLSSCSRWRAETGMAAGNSLLVSFSYVLAEGNLKIWRRSADGDPRRLAAGADEGGLLGGGAEGPGGVGDEVGVLLGQQGARLAGSHGAEAHRAPAAVAEEGVQRAGHVVGAAAAAVADPDGRQALVAQRVAALGRDLEDAARRVGHRRRV